MSIFSIFFNKKKPFTKEIGKTVVKINCTDDQHRLFNEMYECGVDLVHCLENKIDALESAVCKLNADISKLLGGDFGRIADAASDLVDVERNKLNIEFNRHLAEFEKTRGNISEEEKERLFARALLLMKSDADGLNIPACMDGGISSDFNEIYNELRAKHGMKPVPSDPVPGNEWTPTTGTTDKGEKSTESNSKTKTKKGKKNGKKPARNRKAKATGSGDAVSPDKKLEDGQG